MVIPGAEELSLLYSSGRYLGRTRIVRHCSRNFRHNRRRFVPDAIRDFLVQDYPSRELIIVDDGTDPVAEPRAERHTCNSTTSSQSSLPH